MNVGITGGMGFIGRALTNECVKCGYNVRILSRSAVDDLLFKSRVQIMKGDLANDNVNLHKFVAGLDILYHCAGEIRDVSKMQNLHVNGTQRLIRSIKKESEEKGESIHWIQLSSVGAYGPPQGGANIDRIVTEDTPTLPSGTYEITKTQSDNLVIQASESGLMTHSIVRPSNVFGVDMTNQSLNSLAEMVKKGLFFYIGKPGAIATYVHVNDVVEVLLRCCKDQRAKGEIFNISNDCLLEEMINGIADALGVNHPRFRLSEKLMRTVVRTVGKIVPLPLTNERINALVMRTKYPCVKLEQKLDFTPKVSVPNAIGEVVLA